jgi:hypothetical protein
MVCCKVIFPLMLEISVLRFKAIEMKLSISPLNIFLCCVVLSSVCFDINKNNLFYLKTIKLVAMPDQKRDLSRRCGISSFWIRLNLLSPKLRLDDEFV